MPKFTTKEAVCAACGHPASRRLRIMIDGLPIRVWSLCDSHAQLVANRKYAIQLDPDWGGKWLYGDDRSKQEDMFRE